MSTSPPSPLSPSAAAVPTATAATASTMIGHTRSHSMSSNSRPTSIDGKVSTLPSSSILPSPSTTTIRRHHTLSTSSQLTRSERSRARIGLQALEGVDRDFYLPLSPASATISSRWNGAEESTTSPSSSASSFVEIKGDRMEGASLKRPGLVSRNSLLDAEGEEGRREEGHEEDWEKGIDVERERENKDRISPTLSNHSGRSESPFGANLHGSLGRSSLRTTVFEDNLSDGRLRRGKSLNFASSSSSSSSPLVPSFSQPRTNQPPNLSLSLSFAYNNNGNDQQPTSPSGSISPGYHNPNSPSPWAPTDEEVKGLASPGLRRMGSGALRTMAMNDEMTRLGQDLQNTDLSSTNSSSSTERIVPATIQLPRHRSSSSTTPPTTSTTTATPRRLPPLITNLSRAASTSSSSQHGRTASYMSRTGPASASAVVPEIGHSYSTMLASAIPPSLSSIVEPASDQTTLPATSTDWTTEKERLVGSSGPGENLMTTSGGYGVGLAVQQQIQIQVLQSQLSMARQTMGNLNQTKGVNQNYDPYPQQQQQQSRGRMNPAQEEGTLQPPSMVDVQELIALKGYNPINFDLRPPGARFFVIKSYTAEDVFKSLQHEIWASTALGNKRLDKAFRETNGPIYLFFSVNASGNFCGMAEMLSSVDYTTSSTVWASDKWKGILSLRWIFVKDVPLSSLRHIILSNTPENKPVTSSRDTQEIPYVEGCQVLNIMATYPSRSSLLQEYTFYDPQVSSLSTTNGGSNSQQQHHNLSQPSFQQPPQSQYGGMRMNSGYNDRSGGGGGGLGGNYDNMHPHPPPQYYHHPSQHHQQQQQIPYQSQHHLQ